jgi:hypothetical protein
VADATEARDLSVTGQIFNASPGHGLSNASKSCSLAGSSPSHFGQSLSARMTGMSCSSPIALFGSHVKIVQLKTSSPLVGDFHFAHRPAITICAPWSIRYWE